MEDRIMMLKLLASDLHRPLHDSTHHGNTSQKYEPPFSRSNLTGRVGSSRIEETKSCVVLCCLSESQVGVPEFDRFKQ